MDYDLLKIKSYKYWDLYLHENQCYLGRVFLLLREDAGVEDFLSICGEMREEFFEIGEEVKSALKTLFQPDRMNYAALSNTSPKIHVHLVPRYKEPREFDGIHFHDTRWGKNYAPYDKSFVLSEEHLFHIRDAIASELETEPMEPDDLTIRLCTSSEDNTSAKSFRQKHFFDERGIQDPYAWTLGHREYDHYLLEKEGNIIGYANIQHWPGKRAALRIIVIAKSEQKKGYGSYLMQTCEQMEKAKGTKILQTEAHPSAVKFYQHLGYVEMPFDDPEGTPTHEDDTAMGKRL